MIAFLLSSIARVLSWLPLSWNRAVGRLLGRCAWLVNSSFRRVTEFNLRHCYPDKSDNALRKMAQSSLLHTGQQFSECAWIWNRPHAHTLSKITQVHGEQLLNEAMTSARGIILASPHVGNWELTNITIASRTPFIYLYRSPRNRTLEPLLLKWRAYLGGKPAALDSGGIRDALKLLKRGGIVGMLPDQEPDESNGVFAPLFNQPALTMTLLSKLASRSNAQVLYLIIERLPRAQGWQGHFLKADADIAHTDPQRAAAAVNRDVERCIALCPDQYLWSYKRFNRKPDGTRRKY